MEPTETVISSSPYALRKRAEEARDAFRWKLFIFQVFVTLAQFVIAIIYTIMEWGFVKAQWGRAWVVYKTHPFLLWSFLICTASIIICVIIQKVMRD